MPMWCGTVCWNEALVRFYEGRPGLESCLRVTAGLPEETDEFLSALAEVLDE